MRLARGERVEPERLIGFLVVGNGSHDEKLMRALLSLYDQEDFWEMFKVKAEFDHRIDADDEVLLSLAQRSELD